MSFNCLLIIVQILFCMNGFTNICFLTSLLLKLNEKYEQYRKFLKCDYIRYSLSEISTIHTANSHINVIIPREDSVISMLNSYLELNLDVLHAATNNR